MSDLSDLAEILKKPYLSAVDKLSVAVLSQRAISGLQKRNAELEADLNRAHDAIDGRERRIAELEATLLTNQQYYTQQLESFSTRWMKRNAELEATLNRLLEVMPAYHEGSFIVEHYDGDGNYTGTEHVDPVSVVQMLKEGIEQALKGTGVNTPSPGAEPGA